MMPQTPSLRLLFFAWVCFSLAFSTVFQAFLTTFLIDSGYRTPIRNLYELFASGVMVVDLYGYNFIFVKDNGTEISKIQRNSANYRNNSDCIYWANYHKNISIFSLILLLNIFILLVIFFSKTLIPYSAG